MSDWQPIETAPKTEFDFLLLSLIDILAVRITVIGFWDANNECWKEQTAWEASGQHGRCRYGIPWQPTHWQPLPEPPAENETKG